MLGEKIKNYLNQNGIKQTFLAEKTGFSDSTISEICLGNRKIEASELYRICKALNVPLDYFFEE